MFPVVDLMIILTGKSETPIFGEICNVLGLASSEYKDMQMQTFHGMTSMNIRLTIEESFLEAISMSLQEVAEREDVQMAMIPMEHVVVPEVESRFVVSLIAEDIAFPVLEDLSHYLHQKNCSIDQIRQLDHRDIHAMEMKVTSPGNISQDELVKHLIDFKEKNEIDIALQKDSHFRRSKRMIIFDADMTFIQCEVIDELGKLAGVENRIAEITQQAMNGELDFAESLTQRVALLEGLEVEKMADLVDRIPVTPGIEELIRVLKRIGYKIGIVSGGFRFFIDKFKEKFDLDYGFANELEVKDGRLTGKLAGRVIDAQGKADVLGELTEQEQMLPAQVIAVGDGANDLLMLGKAGLGIAFNAKQLVREKSQATLSLSHLKAVLYFLGLTGDEIDELANTES